jgi:hypothetical protein
MQVLGSLPEVEMLRDSDEVANVTQFHGRYSIPYWIPLQDLFHCSEDCAGIDLERP